MKKIILLTFIVLAGLSSRAQSSDSEESVKKVINSMFEGMRKGDSTLVHSTFAPGMSLQSISKREGKVRVLNEDAADFLKAVGKPHAEIWDERISFDKILIDGELASVWTSYKFYVGERFSHCGVNSFQLVKLAEGWKIQYIIDTRRKEPCN